MKDMHVSAHFLAICDDFRFAFHIYGSFRNDIFYRIDSDFMGHYCNNNME